MKALSLVLILCLLIPATAYSQISELNNESTPTQTQTQTVSTQCLDFNQDGTCESIVLANGTAIKNPDLPPRSVSMDGSSSNLTSATNTIASVTTTSNMAKSNSTPAPANATDMAADIIMKTCGVSVVSFISRQLYCGAEEILEVLSERFPVSYQQYAQPEEVTEGEVESESDDDNDGLPLCSEVDDEVVEETPCEDEGAEE